MILAVKIDPYMYGKFIMIADGANLAYLPEMITAGQIRAARALIGWKQTDLASASGVSEISIKNIERGVTDPRSSTLGALQKAFLDAGVVFLDPGDTRNGGPGVRLIAAQERKSTK
jgi:transcriptional regulator with XRE-family HTH domain